MTENIITTLNEHWPIFTAFAAAIASAVTWIINQAFANKTQDKEIAGLSAGCDKFHKRICVLEDKDVEFEKYQMYAKTNRERIEVLERSDRLRVESLGLINTKLAGIETDTKWLRQTMTRGSEQWDKQQ